MTRWSLVVFVALVAGCNERVALSPNAPGTCTSDADCGPGGACRNGGCALVREGGIAGEQVSTLYVVGAAALATARSVMVNGVEQVNDSRDGLFLAVFDLDTHRLADASLELAKRGSTRNIRILSDP